MPGTEVIRADIRCIDPHDLAQRFAVSPGSLDLLFGGPPCQAFASIGKRRSINDDRGMLPFEVVRFARVLLPKAIVIEHVKGLVSAVDACGRKGGVLLQLEHALHELGCQVTHHGLNAADDGVPQVRERVFVIGLRGACASSVPQPAHAPPDAIPPPPARSCRMSPSARRSPA